MTDVYNWRRVAHIPFIIFLQILFIILFAVFVVYDPEIALGSKEHTEGKIVKVATNQEHGVHQEAFTLISHVYPSFQDVHVMIFIGFGFLMTFLKKYGLSAVSLNMLVAVICIEWATLVIGFFHMHKRTWDDGSTSWRIYLNLTDSMLFSDFAAAAVLISFGVILGKTTPLQLILMALIEIVLFVVNEIIGRKYLGAIDAGDTIFVHLFGAYFGLACSRVMYKDKYMHQMKQGSARTSDMFSMIGTIFLWMFWPSFNSAAAADGEPRHRAILNTYFALCACVMAAFSFSAIGNKNHKFVMEHIQNATLAGGVAIGACADLTVQPFGALIIGSIAGIISVYGYDKITPWLGEKLHIHDTCGVHNLHGMPAVLGAFLSCIMAAVATPQAYGGTEALRTVYPLLEIKNATGHVVIPGITPSNQAINQLIAAIVTLVIAIVGGAITGLLLHYVEKWQHIDDAYHRGMTILKLALSVGSITSGPVDVHSQMPVECYFDDNLFFHVHEDNEAEMMPEQNVVITDNSGKERKFRRQSVSTINSY